VADGSFESGLAPWLFTPATTGVWTQECTDAEDGSCALQIANGNLVSGYSLFGCQPLSAPSQGAYYTLGGSIQASGVTTPSNGGGRFQIGSGLCGGVVAGTSTAIVGGTTPWTLSINAMTFLPAGTYSMIPYAYGKPNGTVQFDNISVQQLESPTAEMFLLYPNYMGRLWDDGPQSISADVRGAGTATMVLTNAGGTVLASSPAITLTSTWQTVPMDVSALNLPDGTYTLSLNDPGANYVPQYQIVKGPRLASGYIDENQYLYLPNSSGQLTKRFTIGVYDTGAAWGFVPAWSTYLATFFPAVKADLYLNYFQDGTTQANIEAMGQALRLLGMAGIDTINDRMSIYDWDGIPTSSYLVPRATNDDGQPGLFAWYLADERDQDWSLGGGNPIQGTWGIRTTVRPYAPDMPALIVQNAPQELEPWRDVTDIIGVDPYPVYSNNPVSLVSDWVSQAIVQGHNARPVWAVVQYFGSSDGTGWPSDTELRQETWQAICAGAEGVFYWSLGAVGWQYLDASLQPAELAALETVIDEVKSYEVQLTGTPVVPFPLPLPAGIIGIARQVGATTYVFTCNTTSAVVSDSAGHTWQPYDTQFWSFAS